MDDIRSPYRTLMRFGTDPAQVVEVQWQFCQDTAEALGIPTPFCSRDKDQHEIWPDLGEVQFAQRIYDDNFPPSVLPGTGPPCGDPNVWTNGYPGHVPPDYPRNIFGHSLCCAGPLGLCEIGIEGEPYPEDLGGPGVGGQEDAATRATLENIGGPGVGGLEDLPRPPGIELVGGLGVGGRQDLVGLADRGGPAAGGLADLVGVELLGGPAAGGLEDTPSQLPAFAFGNSQGGAGSGAIGANFGGGPTTPGSLLTFGVAAGLGATVTMPAGWTLLTSQTDGTRTSYIFTKISAGESTVTFTLSGPCDYVWAAGQFSLGLLANVADQMAGDSGSGTMSADTGTTAPTTQAVELCLGMIGCFFDNPSTVGGGFVVPADWANAQANGGTMGYRVTGVTGAQQMTVALAVSGPWVGTIVTIK